MAQKTWKTTKKHFEYYCKCFAKWQGVFNLMNYKVWVVHEEYEGAAGFCRADMEGMCAVIGLTKEWGEVPSKERLNEVARHEALELLLAPMWHAVLARDLNRPWAESQRHSIIRTLEGILVD